MADPAGNELLPQIERLAERTGDWTGLLEVYARIARARPELGDRVQLLRLRSEVKERRLTDPSGALDELVRSFALSPNNAATQNEILRLAGVTGRWEDALKVQAQLFALAEDLPRKLTVARHAAVLMETEVKDLVRAFRAYLNAFRLAPEDPEIVGHLWRLATRIGRYETAPKITERAEKALGAMDDQAVPDATRTPAPEAVTATDDDDDTDAVVAATGPAAATDDVTPPVTMDADPSPDRRRSGRHRSHPTIHGAATRKVRRRRRRRRRWGAGRGNAGGTRLGDPSVGGSACQRLALRRSRATDASGHRRPR